jgi:DNA-binding response OmpR family regulator
MQSKGDILVIDDEPAIVEFMTEALTDEGYVVRTALTTADARAMIAERHPDLMLLDVHMPGESGDVLARDLNNDGLAHVPIIIMTADAQVAKSLAIEGIDYCLAKPFDLDELIECVAKHIRRNGTGWNKAP